MIYVVLGMHKSGTTLVSEVLHHSGINMGDDIDTHVSYDEGNKYERPSSLALNMEILGAKGSYVTDQATPDTLQMTEDQRARMRKIIQDCDRAYDNWGFKDPRTCLVYPLWASELPEHRIIAIYRPPDEVWPHFRYKGLRSPYANPRRAWRFINSWDRFNTNILTYLQNTKMNFLVLSYKELMATQAEFDRLQEFIGFKLENRRKASLYRHRPKAYPLLRIATWLAYKRTGRTPEKTIEQLEALRRK